jgi:glyoxylase-like metal-dependent hydrolase (beta-lactamase superfamily II)
MSAAFRIAFIAALGWCLPALCHAQAQAAPAAAALPKPDYRIQQVRPNLAVLTSPGGNIAVWSGPSGVVLVDDGLASLAPQLLEAVGRVSKGPVRFVVNTHWHPDHTGGNEALAKAGATIIAHEGVRDRMLQPQQFVEEAATKVPAAAAAALPVVTFTNTMALQLDGERIDIVHFAGAHTDSDVVVRWQDANAVHMGDLFWNGGYPFIDLASGGSLAGIVAALEGVLARIDAQTAVIPGHGAVATRGDLAAYRDMLVAVGRKVREAVEAGASVDEVIAAHPTADFDEHYGKGVVSPERFIRTLYRDLAPPRSSR